MIDKFPGSTYNRLKQGINRLFLLLFFILFSVSPNPGYAETGEGANLVIGRMKVTIMPEYDTSQVLVILEGKFKDKGAFPTEALFILPKGVKKLTDVCSLSPGGQHFCQIYEIKEKKEWSESLVKLPYSDFFVDFQYAPFIPEPGKPRDFKFELRLPYPAEILETHIQEPFRAKDFSLSPTTDDSYVKRDFNYYRYKMENVPKEKVIPFTIKYLKDDVRPSVDIKFSSMGEPELVESKRGNFFLVVGVVFLVVLGGFSFIRNKKAAR